MPTATDEEAKRRRLEPSRHSQEVGQNKRKQHQPCAQLSLSCNNEPATQQKQKYFGPSDYIKARLIATSTPVYDPYSRDRINQQLDQAISILFSPSQINQNKRGGEQQHQHVSGSVSNEDFCNSEAETITQKLPAKVATQRKQKPVTKQQFEDVVKKKRKSNGP